MYCESCRIERAREASAKNWQRTKIRKEMKRSKLLGRRIVDTAVVNAKLAARKGVDIGEFNLWAIKCPQEYEKLLEENGYRYIKNSLYEIPKTMTDILSVPEEKEPTKKGD